MIGKYLSRNKEINFPKTEKEVREICRKFYIKNYTINDDLSINVSHPLDVRYNTSLRKINRLPIKYNKVDGWFSCRFSNLTSLEGSPNEIDGYFNCSNNHINSLEGVPKINGKYMSTLVNKYLIDFRNNNVKSFKGIPEDFEGFIWCENNPVYEIHKLLDINLNPRCVYWLNEYDVIQGDNVIMNRLEEVFHQLDISIPDIKEIKGYNLI